jgi:signal peptidase I
MLRPLIRLGTALAIVATLALSGLIALGPYELFVVRTGSMSPTIPPTSAVLVDPSHRPTRRDVITFTDRGKTTTHRLLGVRRDGTLITKGDANDDPDPWRITSANVRATVIGSLDKAGWAIVFLRQPTGLLSIVCAAVAVWLAWSIVTYPPPTARPPSAT